MPSNDDPVFIFAGGGTGGHLYPGLAIAEQLAELTRGRARCIFACSDRPLDTEILSREGVAFTPIPARPLGLRPRAFLRFCRSWGPAVRAGRDLIRKQRGTALPGGDPPGGSPVPLHVIAMGGFVAAPVIQAARAERIPITLVNMDAIPGKANRWIARHASRILTSAPVANSPWERIPPIVRRRALADRPREGCIASFDLDPARPVLLVTGGSQGARSINELLEHLVRADPTPFTRPGWQVIHQTGPGDWSSLAAAYAAAGIPARVQPYIQTMGLAWGAADLALCRAGAGNVAEAWASAVPALFLPYPFHKDEHQRFNAAPVADAGAALIVRDLIDPARNLPHAGRALSDLLTDAARRARMQAALRALGPADGARRVASALVRTLGTDRPSPP